MSSNAAWLSKKGTSESANTPSANMCGNYEVGPKNSFGRVLDVQKRPWKTWVLWIGVEVRGQTKINGKNQ